MGRLWEWIHGIAVIIFIIIWILAVPFGWIQSVTFVSHMSMIALVYAAVSAWQAARVERKEDEKDS